MFIDNALGDASWSGSDYSLKKLRKNGKISTARHNIAFWTLCTFCSDPSLNEAASEHNAKHATITVRDDITTEYVSEYFANKATGARNTLEWDTRRGHSPKVLAREEAIAEHYEHVAKQTAVADTVSAV